MHSEVRGILSPVRLPVPPLQPAVNNHTIATGFAGSENAFFVNSERFSLRYRRSASNSSSCSGVLYSRFKDLHCL
jgi:hypothetical protein